MPNAERGNGRDGDLESDMIIGADEHFTVRQQMHRGIRQINKDSRTGAIKS